MHRGAKLRGALGLEGRIRAHPLVSQCLVVGDGRPFEAALVTLDTEAIRWLVASGRTGAPATVTADPEVLAALYR